jgi:hypothetical protein
MTNGQFAILSVFSVVNALGFSGNLVGNFRPEGPAVNSQGRQPLEGDA